MRDRQLIFAAVFVRAVGISLLSILFGIYLARVGFEPGAMGTIVSLGLAGAAAATLLATLFADRLGRKRFLILVALVSAVGAGVVLYAGGDGVVVAIASFVGMLNGMGRDRGAALVIEQAILPATTSDQERTSVFAWYNVLQDGGHALGSLLAGFPVVLRSAFLWSEERSLGAGLVFYVGLMLLSGLIYVGLSSGVEPREPSVRKKLSEASRKIVLKISLLFSLDSLGGGFLTNALLSFFFFQRFGVSEGVIGALFFGARLANAASHLGASWLAKRIGLVKTMVFTHIPSSLLLVTVAIAPNFWVAAILFLIREGLVEMDVPTRQSYVMAVVQPDERTVASGITSLVRVAAWAVAPSLAGLFLGQGSLHVPLFAAAGMKITYDLLLYRAFHEIRPPEEQSVA